MTDRLHEARETVALRLGGVGVAECIEALIDAKLAASAGDSRVALAESGELPEVLPAGAKSCSGVNLSGWTRYGSHYLPPGMTNPIKQWCRDEYVILPSAETLPRVTPEMLDAQRKSWARGEMAMGSDADEARERAAPRDTLPLDVALDAKPPYSVECWRCGNEVGIEYAAAGFRCCSPCYDAERETGAARKMLAFMIDAMKEVPPLDAKAGADAGGRCACGLSLPYHDDDCVSPGGKCSCGPHPLCKCGGRAAVTTADGTMHVADPNYAGTTFMMGRARPSTPEPASEGPVVSKTEIAGEDPTDDELRVIYAEAQRMVVDLGESIHAARRALYNRGLRDGERKGIDGCADDVAESHADAMKQRERVEDYQRRLDAEKEHTEFLRTELAEATGTIAKLEPVVKAATVIRDMVRRNLCIDTDAGAQKRMLADAVDALLRA